MGNSAALNRLGLRDHWKSFMQSLTAKGIPTYLFSSGYGDVVMQALLQSGIIANPDVPSVPSSANPMYMNSFPQNVRVISNFFRTGPDGTVRGFSQPIVHDR